MRELSKREITDVVGGGLLDTGVEMAATLARTLHASHNNGSEAIPDNGQTLFPDTMGTEGFNNSFF